VINRRFTSFPRFDATCQTQQRTVFTKSIARLSPKKSNPRAGFDVRMDSVLAAHTGV
jgi:hypothetical protein